MWHFETGSVVSTLVMSERLQSMIIQVFYNLSNSMILYLCMLGFTKVYFSMEVRTSSDDTESAESSIKDLLSVYLSILSPSLNF